MILSLCAVVWCREVDGLIDNVCVELSSDLTAQGASMDDIRQAFPMPMGPPGATVS